MSDSKNSLKSAIGYVLARYPLISETFVQREVSELRQRNIEVKTYSIRKPGSDGKPIGFVGGEKATASILPISAARLIRCHARALRNFRAYVSTFWFAIGNAGRDPRRALWQMFYFAEAIVLWGQCHNDVRHLHAHFANVASDVARLATHYGNRVEGGWTWSFTMHGPTEFYDIERFGLKEKLRNADFVVCISDYCRSQVMALLDPTEWDKLEVVHCGVDTSLFEPPVREVKIAPPLNVLCVGRLVPEKGQTLIVEAIDRLRARGVDVSLDLIGEGPSRALLQSEIVRRNLTDRVRLLGAVGQNEIREHYGRADLFCLPSSAEGLPVVLMEALAAGVPTVTTRITGIPELVIDGVTGLLITPGRADQLADAFERLAADPELRQRLSVAGRQKVRDEFELRLVGEQLAKVYETRIGIHG